MSIKKAIRRKRYPIVNGNIAIEIKVNYLNQLFDERDPSPFREKDLDDDAVDYMVSSVQEISPHRVQQLLVFVVQGEQESSRELDTRNAIHQFFKYESERMAKKIHSTLKIGFKSMLIGFGFLTFSVLTSILLSKDPQSFWSLFLKEGLLLMGWVSMWKPINIFLYEWWPLSDLKKIYLCLAQVEVVFIYLSQAESSQK